MYLSAIKVEFKKIIRDKMALLLTLYPIILGFIGKVLINNPKILGNGEEAETGMQIVIVLFSIIGAYMFGAVLGLSLLEDREDRVLESVKVSPINTDLYIWIRTSIICILGLLGNIFVMHMTTDFEFLKIVIISIVSTLQIPAVAFFMNMIAKNKVEGFVAIKGSSFIFMIPVIGAFFFTDWKEFLFSPSPGFWAAKATQSLILNPLGVETNLTFYGYIIVGLLYEIILILFMYKLFKNKEKI